MITYNHEKFVAQAIEGVLMQQTSFPIELVIGEDYSTDNTRKICEEYKAKYPNQIRLLLHESNLGMMQNFITTLQACTSKYIALCEGDDYWTDPYKLQKQVDFLEANPDFSICFHSVKIWQDGKYIEDYITREVTETTTILDLAKGNYIHTPSVVFRKNNDVTKQFISKPFPIGDYVLHMLNAKYGKIKKLPDCMSVYRLHANGSWGQKDDEYRISIWIDLLVKLSPYFQGKVKNVLELQTGKLCCDKYITLIIKNKNEETLKYFQMAAKFAPDYLHEKVNSQFNLYQNDILHLRNTKAYRLGKFILKPFSFIRHKLKTT